MFKFIDRNQQADLVLISGWAFDHRIFEPLDLPFNYFHYCGQCSDDFEIDLTELLKIKSIEKVSILGWSKGAFIAADFAAKNPQKIDSLILVGARKKYDKEHIEVIKNYIKKNQTAFLLKFYRDCFGREERQNYIWFKQTLQKEYLSEMSQQHLLQGLDQLAAMHFDFDALRSVENIKIIHGLNDAVAPASDAADLANNLPNSQLITFESSGHMPFLHPDFKASLI